MNVAVFDLHCDTAFEMLGRGGQPDKILRTNDLHVDLQRAAALPAYAQCFACFSSTLRNSSAASPQDIFRREVDKIKQQVSANSDVITLASNADQIRKNRENRRISAILTAEGSAGINFSPDALPMLRDEGFCAISLCWNEQNPLTGSHIAGGGLTEQGRAFVKQAQALGLVIDVSHISDEAFWDIMDITVAPVIASHSNSRSVHRHSRNLSDDMFSAICATGGVAGINLYTAFLGGTSLDAVCNHIFRYLELDPDGTHIAIGGDLDGCDSLPAGINGIEDYPKLACRLAERGLPDHVIQNIFWNNALGVIEHCCT